MGTDSFDGQLLTEKLTKLNNSQQSIESLSRWCVSHRKKAKQIVETWDTLVNSSKAEQCVSFLYLANDILQNSRRKGREFVNEFWKVLPSCLGHIYRNSDENAMKSITRLVNIWEERKVFGSRGQNLKDQMLVNDLSLIKIMKKDAHSIRIKLSVEGWPAKIVTAFQDVYDEHFNEELAFSKCGAALVSMGALEKDAKNNLGQDNEQTPELVDKLENEENALQQCVEQLETVETTRSALVFHLKEALQDQEQKLELIQTQLQVARGHIEKASSMRQKLKAQYDLATLTSANGPMLAVAPMLTCSQPQSTQPVVTVSTSQAIEENMKSTAALVAAKLAASTSSAQMLTSVLSSLVAEEAASKNGGIKRPKLEKPMWVPDIISRGVSFATFPPLPPHPNPNQHAQLSGSMTGGMVPYGFTPDSLHMHISMGLVPRSVPPHQSPPQHVSVGGFYLPSDIGFFGQTTSPPVTRQ